MSEQEKLVIALPKGRILDEVMPLVQKCGIEPEAAFDSKSRAPEICDQPFTYRNRACAQL